MEKLYTGFADAAPLLREDLYQKYYENATKARQEKADRYREPLDRAMCIVAEVLLRKALRESLSSAGGFEKESGTKELRFLPEDDLEYGFNENSFNEDNLNEYVFNEYGKPYLLRHPEIHFNLSHSHGKVMVAMAHGEDVDVGCDIEMIRPADMKVAKRFFAENEYRALMAEEDPEKRNALFFELWTLKESFIKAVGKGMAIPLRSFEIRIRDDIQVVYDNAPGEFSFRVCEPFPGFKAAVCIQSKSPEQGLKGE